MSAITTPESPPAARPPAGGPQAARARLNAVDRRGNRALTWLAFTGGAVVFLVMFFIAYEVIIGASSAIGKLGLPFLVHTDWNPGQNIFSGWPFIYGTLVTSVLSVILATILGVSIGLFLALMAPRWVSAIVGPLVEMLAAIPSVVLGLIGIYLIAPFIHTDIEGWLHAALGWIPVFGPAQPIGQSLFTASLVLTIMVVPIIAALTRDLFLTVPQELRDGAEALGATRWEMIRAVVLPTTRSGVIAACVLGFGRAIGEAIAVSQVVGDKPLSPVNWFLGGDTLASRIALQWEGTVSNLHASVLFYLALILFVFGLIVNLLARFINRRGLQV